MYLSHLSPHSTWNTLHHGARSHLHKLDQHRSRSHMTVFSNHHAVVNSRTSTYQHPIAHIPGVAQHVFPNDYPITYSHVFVAMHNRFFLYTGLLSDGDLP